MDDRRRVPVPAKMMSVFRQFNRVKEDDPVEVVVALTPAAKLGVYPKRVFDEKVRTMRELIEEEPSVADLLSSLVKYMDEQCLDKQNRFRVPPSLADIFGLEGEVVILGNVDHFEVVKKDKLGDCVLDDATRIREGVLKMAERKREARHQSNGK